MLFLFLLNVSFGQKNHVLQLESGDKPAEFFTKKFSYRTHLKDSTQARTEVTDLFNKLRSFGYFAASIDSITGDTTKTVAYIYVGDKFDNIVIKKGNAEPALLANAGVKNTVLNEKKMPVADAELVKAKVLRECENTGYPFASVRLDSFTYNGNQYSAKLFVQKNEPILYDSLQIQGKTKTKKVFLRNYLGIKIGKPYNESNIRKIQQRLNELQFVEAIQPHTVLFQNGKARVNLFLKDKKSSQFDFLLGFLPGSSGQKLLITGEARIHLFSLFGVGEEFYLQWKKLQPKTQELDVRVVYPYLLGLPLGINARFQLYKRDTSYVDIDGDYGVQYQFVGSNYLKASLRQKITIITNIDTAYIRSARTLPKNLDISTNEFALEYFLQKLNYRFNPVSGYVLRVSGSAGVKQIKRNTKLINMYDEIRKESFGFLYDTTRLKTFQFRLALSIEKYWKLAPRHTIKTSAEGKYFFTRNIFENEKYRLGGVSSLRGFDDQSIFTPYYAMANVEYRFLLSKNSYFSAFFNAAVVEDTRVGKGPVDFPYGFGAGAAIETKVGIFGLTYAMGNQLDNKLSIKSAKIHIGYVNYF
ncbi:MAG TPA: BamA/TamA family outer membrane protein [Chitinophagales bacterium]|nr:BamA/TamA family outer membrane protein [Chitinophagales bacterium]